ncbi:MAG: MFS transporter [Betaproteobacteria bacterium]
MSETIAKGSAPTKSAPMTAEERKVIFASSLGTVFEWYDFYIYGTLSLVIGKAFLSPLDPGSQAIMTLLIFAAGFVVRPFGAIVFGRLGDLVGRKYTFLITIMLMGLSTFAIGFLPAYNQIGVWAPIILITLRMLQGLALGGEYGGAATYIAEHAPHGKRASYTSWIQTTATLGLVMSLVMLWVLGNLGINFVDPAKGSDWWAGWRIPFIFSIVLLGISVWIRLTLSESPAFQKMKEDGKLSKSPLSESFGQWKNLKIVFLALFGLVAGQAVIWYGGQFYAQIFLRDLVKIDPKVVNELLLYGLLLGTPFFIVFGFLADKIGRKIIIMLGLLLGVICYIPGTPVSIFSGLVHYGNPALEKSMIESPVSISANLEDCSFQFNPTGTLKFTSSCDIAKQTLAANSVNYTTVASNAGPGTMAKIKIGDKEIESFTGELNADKSFTKETLEKVAAFKKEVRTALDDAKYPAKADPTQINRPMIVLLLTFLMILVTMVYAPIAALLVELFPTRIRYSSMSLPYHIGNGWFGGFLPAISTALVLDKGSIFAGLWYPVIIAAITLVIGTLFVPETKDVDIYAND